MPPDTAAAPRDLSTLAWVHDELQHALEQAHRALLRAQRERADGASQALSEAALAALAHAAGLTHQVSGALVVLGLMAPARHARATEAALRHLMQHPAALTPEALTTVGRGHFTLQDYLRRLLAQQPIGELALWPSYQMLCQLAAEARCHPADLAALPAAAPLPLPAAAPLAEGPAARAEMERALLAGLRGDTAALRRLAALCLGLAAGASGEVQALWHWAAACFDGQAAGRIALDEHSRRIGSRLLARLRGSANADAPALLLRDLQFFCASASPGAPAHLLDAALAGSGLPRIRTDPESMPELGRIDPASVPQAQRRARTLRDTWAAVAGEAGEPRAPLADHLAQWSESIRQLLPQGDGLAAAMAAAVAAHTERPNPEMAMEVATTLLCVEAALEDMSFDQPGRAAQFDTLAERLRQSASGEPAGPIEPWMEQLYRDASDRQTMGSVTQELRAHLGEVELRLDHVSRQPDDRSPLADVPSHLTAMRGVFTVLDMGQAAQAVLRMRDDVDDAIRGVSQPDADARMAHNVSALSLLIDLLAVQPAVAKKLFRFDPVSGRISALMGHAPDGSTRPAPLDVAPEHASEPATPAPRRVAPAVAPDELHAVFVDEAREVLAEGQAALGQLRTQPGDVVGLRALRRVFHTLKGSAAMVALTGISVAARACEMLCNRRLEAEAPYAEPEMLALAERALVALANAVAAKPDAPAPAAALAALAADAEALLAGPAAAPSALAPSALDLAAMPGQEARPAATPTADDRVDPAADTAPDGAADGAADERDPLEFTLDLDLDADWHATQAASLSGGRLPTPAVDDAVDVELDFDMLDEPTVVIDGPDAAEAAPHAAAELADDATQPQPEHAQEPAAAAQAEPEPESAAHQDAVAVLEADSEPTRNVGDLRIPIKLFNIFLNEADEHSRQLGTLLAEWAMQPQAPVDPDAVRLAHALGGEGATVGFTALGGAARWLEHALERVAGGTTGASAALLLDVADALRRLLHQFAAGFLHGVPPELAARMDAWQPAQPAPNVVALRGTAAPEGLSDAAPEPDRRQRARDVQEALDAQAEPLRGHDAPDPALWEVFVPEAQELLSALAQQLRAWEAKPGAGEPAHAVLRALHTFKGGARLAGAMALGERAHRLESVVEQGLREGATLDLAPVQQGLDRLNEAFERLQAGAAAAPVAVADAGSEPSTLQLPADAQRKSVRVHAKLLDRMVAQAGEVGVARAHLEAELARMREGVGELATNLERLRGQLRELDIQIEGQMSSRTEAARSAHEGFDPLELDRFTRAQELTRMLAEAVNDVGTLQRSLQQSILASEDHLVLQGRLARGLQEDLLRARMLEFDTLSDRLYRVVRQAANETGKQVRLHLEGGHIEIDRGVLDHMAPAFEHLLRNAVVHGIEPPRLRESLHKDPIGTIEVRLRTSGNEVLIEVQDDGAGLDLARIAERARQRGWLAEDARPTEAELAQLIFRPGFSTVSEVSELAGRGVGMDVVRTEVAALGGRVDVSSESAKGTRLLLVLPLSTAITQVVPVRSGAWQIALPATLIEQVVQVPAVRLEAAHGDRALAVDGQLLPLWRLAALLDGGAAAAPAMLAPDGEGTVLVVHSADQRVALHVDAAMPREEVVVKNMGPQLARLPALSGVYLRADGSVAPIYHPLALAGLFGEAANRQMADASTPRAPSAAGEGKAVLVVDDSVTVRRVTQRLLEREGWRPVLARDGEEALSQLAALAAEGQRPVAVLSDIEMPRMDGFELLRALRAKPETAALPVVMITSRIAERHREQAMALGATAYLGKPYPEDELLALVKQYAASPL